MRPDPYRWLVLAAYTIVSVATPRGHRDYPRGPDPGAARRMGARDRQPRAHHPGHTRMKLYRQGQLVASAEFADTPAGTCAASIGGVSACGFQGQFFAGFIDEILSYDRALTEVEIASLYGAESGGLAADGTACTGGTGSAGVCQPSP